MPRVEYMQGTFHSTRVSQSFPFSSLPSSSSLTLHPFPCIDRTLLNISQWRHYPKYSPWPRRTRTRWCELACRTSTTATTACWMSSAGRGGAVPADRGAGSAPIWSESSSSSPQERRRCWFLQGHHSQHYPGHSCLLYHFCGVRERVCVSSEKQLKSFHQHMASVGEQSVGFRRNSHLR